MDASLLGVPPAAGPGAPPHVYTVATHYLLGLHNLLHSLRYHGFSYQVLAFGTKWAGWRGRMTAYRDAARAHADAHGPDSLVAFIDAYDALCVRDADGLRAEFEAAGKPVLIGLEAGCQEWPWKTNCGHIEPYWRATRGEVPRRPNIYANGGFIMGRASAVGDVYAWMLDAGYEDDQLGLAGFVKWHPALVAVDEESRVVENHYWLDEANERTMNGEGGYFIHYAGLKDVPGAYTYNKDVQRFAGPMGLALVDYTNAKWLWKAGAGALLLALLAIAVATGYRFGRARRRQGGGGGGGCAAAPAGASGVKRSAARGAHHGSAMSGP